MSSAAIGAHVAHGESRRLAESRHAGEHGGLRADVRLADVRLRLHNDPARFDATPVMDENLANQIARDIERRTIVEVTGQWWHRWNDSGPLRVHLRPAVCQDVLKKLAGVRLGHLDDLLRCP